ncbi:MAG: hypothetical protein ACLR23_15060 [Clostridia bacterium]
MDGLAGGFAAPFPQIAPKANQYSERGAIRGEEVKCEVVLKIDPEQKPDLSEHKGSGARCNHSGRKRGKNIKSYTQDSDAIGVSLKEAFKGF